jgi:hypothetical protein
MELTELLIADLAGRKEWDQPPELRLLWTDDDGSPRIGEMSLIPKAAWSAGRVPDWLEFVASGMESAPPEVRADIATYGADTGCQGVMLFLKTPMVDPRNVHAADQLSAQARDHKLWQHPDRISMRLLVVSLADGREGILTQMYGMDPVVAEPINMKQAVGALPQQVRRLRGLLCGSPIGRRQPRSPGPGRQGRSDPSPEAGSLRCS